MAERRAIPAVAGLAGRSGVMRRPDAFAAASQLDNSTGGA
jgi:hypothetical protein